MLPGFIFFLLLLLLLLREKIIESDELEVQKKIVFVYFGYVLMVVVRYWKFRHVSNKTVLIFFSILVRMKTF